MAMALKRMNETNPQELGEYPNYFYVYYNQFVAPVLMGIFSHAIVFYQNKDLRKAFLAMLKDIFLNVKEKIKK
jgi:hypothetical protein